MVDFPGFEAHPVDLPNAAEMPLHADAGERLRGAEIRFRGEVRGPESVAFDPRGRGPYTGVADGRVLVWDGARSAYLAHASPAWTVDLCGGPKAFPTEYLRDEHVCGPRARHPVRQADEGPLHRRRLLRPLQEDSRCKKKKAVHKTATTDDKRVQSTLKRVGVNTI
ncbi:protein STRICTOSIDINE SYNTHASE-LIKE 3-like [Hordeum vulgare]|nr:protein STRICTOSIDINE SYNTHASE-LIKE 3-like [Hordeum vulgare]